MERNIKREGCKKKDTETNRKKKTKTKRE